MFRGRYGVEQLRLVSEQSYLSAISYFVIPYYYFFTPIPPKPRVINTTNVSAAQAESVQATASVISFTVKDTVAIVAAYFNSLNGDTRRTGITLTTSGPISITARQFASDTFVESKLPSGTLYSLSGVAVANAAAIQATAPPRSPLPAATTLRRVWC